MKQAWTSQFNLDHSGMRRRRNQEQKEEAQGCELDRQREGGRDEGQLVQPIVVVVLTGCEDQQHCGADKRSRCLQALLQAERR